ncbi:MAG: ORF6N domain-containing protein [Clostridiales Family XIII bacterium]|jgi:hypothetical protein|nr:ORF6N domain-containing protein [Clostridiales Family XIII bacterium]
MEDIIKAEQIEDKILDLRGQQALLDSDVARFYGVETKRVNEAVKNNPDKFPEGYLILLSEHERNQLVENFDRFNNLKHSSAKPTAFTERGLYMLATILKGPRATQPTLAIVATFAKIRELSRILNQLPDAGETDKQRTLATRSSEIMAAILDDNMEVKETETSVEVNFAVVKVKRTVKCGKKE